MKNFKLNIEPSPTDERDYIAESIIAKSKELPEICDLRDNLLPVRDQGEQGSCAAMSSACMKEWQERKDVRFEGYMSPQFIYNNRKNQDSEGMYARDVMKILSKVGSVPEIIYPYETEAELTDNLKDIAKKYRIKGYAAIHTIEGFKSALVSNGPCYIAFPVYNFGGRFWKPEQGDVSKGGHAVTCVGYNKKGFIIRNSWGNWNGDGYTIFPYEDFGSQWEIWTTIDENSTIPYKTPGKSKSWIGIFINWLMSFLK